MGCGWGCKQHCSKFVYRTDLLDPLPSPSRRLGIGFLELCALGSGMAEDRALGYTGDAVTVHALTSETTGHPPTQLQDHWQPDWYLSDGNLEDSFLGKMTGTRHRTECWGLGVPQGRCPKFTLVNPTVEGSCPTQSIAICYSAPHSQKWVEGQGSSGTWEKSLISKR